MGKVGVPDSWFPWLASLKAAGALGLLVGLGVPVIGAAAAVGVVLYFIGAVVTHVRAKDYEIAPPAVPARADRPRRDRRQTIVSDLCCFDAICSLVGPALLRVCPGAAGRFLDDRAAAAGPGVRPREGDPERAGGLRGHQLLADDGHVAGARHLLRGHGTRAPGGGPGRAGGSGRRRTVRPGVDRGAGAEQRRGAGARGRGCPGPCAAGGVASAGGCPGGGGRCRGGCGWMWRWG